MPVVVAWLIVLLSLDIIYNDSSKDLFLSWAFRQVEINYLHKVRCDMVFCEPMHRNEPVITY